jgi:predicted nucleic acid-binding protein
MEGINFSDRETLVRLAQFFFKRESEEYRKNFQESIVEYAIYLLNNRGADFQGLLQTIKDKIGAKLSDLIIKDILERCVKERKVVVKDSKFFLSEKMRDLIRKTVEERSKVLKRLEKLVIATFYKNYPDFPKDLEKIILDSVYRIFSRICISNIKIIISALNPKFTLSENEITPISTLLEHLSQQLGIRDEKFNYALRKTFQEIFTNKEFSKILAFMTENYLLIELLNLDPALNMLESKLLQKRVLFFDTNVLISLIIDSDMHHEITIKLVNLMKQLNVRMVYTERTKEEILQTLNKADISYKELSARIKRTAVLENINNIYIRDFYRKRAKNPFLTWEGYFLTLKNKFEEYLSNYGINLLKVEQFSIDENLFDYVKNLVKNEALSVGNIKEPNVVEHDAHHILLIRRYRQEEKDPLGPLLWFITYDTSLYFVDKKLNEYLNVVEAPSSIEVDVWLSFISPFIPSTIMERELPELYGKLMKTFFATVPIKLDPKNLIEIAGPWIDYESLSLEDINRILYDSSIRNLLARIDEAKKRNIREAEELRKELYANIESKVAKQLDERILKLENEINNMKKEKTKTSYKLIGLSLAFWILMILLVQSLFGNTYLGYTIILLSFIIILWITGTINYVKAKIASFLELEIKKT